MKPYFEGWYFKHQKGANTIAFIPGVNIDKNGGRHAFLQIITKDNSYNIDYDFSQFECEESKGICPEIRLDDSYFSHHGVKLNINTEKLSVKGTITYGRLLPIKYDIMGPFKYLPFMECRHGIISMRHEINGCININGVEIDLDGGTGYIETDRGRSFPSDYFWTQSNFQIDNNPVDIVLAAAAIPVAGFKFRGCICVIYFNNKEYRLATYLGCRIVKYSGRCLVVRQGRYELEIRLIQENPHQLLAPDLGKMIRTIHESPSCTVRYKFSINNNLMFDAQNDCACFEYVPSLKN